MIHKAERDQIIGKEFKFPTWGFCAITSYKHYQANHSNI